VDAANLAVRKRYQDPYGVPRGTTDGPWADNHGFLGGFQNTTGLTHLGARDYDPLTGSFTTPDPVLDPSQPAHLNAYTYGFDNPIGSPDPTGLEPMLDICGKTTGASDSLDCRNAGYTGSTGNSEHNDWYNHYKPSSVWACGWSRDCLTEHRDVTTKGTPPPTRERAEAIYREFHHEAMTVDEILQFGWQMTGIPDLRDCLTKPGWGPCIATGINLLPYLKEGAVAEALSKVTKVARSLEDVQFLKDLVQGGDDAIDVAMTSCKVSHSFTGDTRVLMADGSTRPIAGVKVGDKIMNAEPDGRGGEVHTVTAVHVTTDDRDRIELTTASGSGHPVSTTEHHQIWEARSHHWVEAGELQPGDKFETLTGNLTIAKVRSSIEQGATYDLAIDSLHTYYVLAGTTPILVHNTSGCGLDVDVASASGARIDPSVKAWRYDPGGSCLAEACRA
jgi:RHS repeat-associated protein